MKIKINKISIAFTLFCLLFLNVPAKAQDDGFEGGNEEEYNLQNYNEEIEGENVIFDNEPDFDSPKEINKNKSYDTLKDEDLSRYNDNNNKKKIDDSEDSIKEKTEENSEQKISEMDPNNFTDTVVIQALDKVTAKSSYLEAKIGDKIVFQRLEIYPMKCWKAPADQKPENKMLLKIYENKLDGNREEAFYGWMFSSSPSISTLEHPVYDITAIECKSTKKEEVLNNGSKK
jgi:hypothetical protein